MNTIPETTDDAVFQRRALEAAIRIGLVVLLVMWCFNIIRPFVMPILWGVIIAVAIYPLHMKISAALGGRRKTAATLLTVLGLLMLITPTVMVSDAALENSQTLAQELKAGTLTIPPPSEKVKSWPLIGNRLYSAWDQASSNLGEALGKYQQQLEQLGKKALSAAAGVGVTVLQFIISIIIAGVLLVYAASSSRAVEAVANRLLGSGKGTEFSEMAGATIRSVAQGVLGIALIQSILAGIGLFVMGVPYAGLWSLLVLLLAIIQLPTILVLGPIIIYVFSVAATVPAVLFMIWSLLVGLSDNILKPLLLGRGLDIPMLVILLGAIGGMILSGIIGLFVGAVVLALGYRLFTAWLGQGARPKTAADTESAGG
ncbi:MAG TPA: AI-2E family transporter [Gammaproteobacteria bacterium]|nr:AI-2E family transporter [Gammaproteobacteria bacterium]